ncbi:hypothetical protein BXZ70DRAFT_630157 [Cristinia sonorae]|uniref:Secreted protein n=1 Tax=Cristinia sonorae TaxID=1940300 RepID=A0A8K0UEK4_9AGAR|nr:hypothetical protein BXZ70DRAFT_630157 [Cristinia sonorae]
MFLASCHHAVLAILCMRSVEGLFILGHVLRQIRLLYNPSINARTGGTHNCFSTQKPHSHVHTSSSLHTLYPRAETPHASTVWLHKRPAGLLNEKGGRVQSWWWVLFSNHHADHDQSASGQSPGHISFSSPCNVPLLVLSSYSPM